MSLSTGQQKLEKYFAKKYIAKYVELGGFFYIKDYRIFAKSPMQKYFISGKYKELNDPKLESYWAEIKKQDVHWSSIGIVVLIIVMVIIFLVNT